MKDETAAHLAKAVRSVQAARHLLGEGFADFAASRAYYAMFYVAEALLTERGLRFRKHAGVHAAYGKHFAQTAVLDPKFHRWMLEAFALRIDADYAAGSFAEARTVEEMLERAAEFADAARDYLET